jgi:tetratricopeptide (TPR) repeat protein
MNKATDLRLVFLASAFGILIATGVISRARSSEELWNMTLADVSVCDNNRMPPDTKIAACARLINEIGHNDAQLARLYSNRGAGYAAKKDWDHALADYTAAISIDPTNNVAYYNRGDAWYRKGKLSQAIEDFSNALRLNPSFSQARMARAVVFLATKDFAHALADTDEMVSLDPHSALASETRAYVLKSMGRRDEAIAEYRKALELASNSRQLRVEIESALKELGAVR